MKKISEKVKQSMKNNILPNMCVHLENVYHENYVCPGLYKISDHKIGKGTSGKVYETCCENVCSYVAKWQEDVERSIREATLQNEIYHLDPELTTPVHEVWECSDGVFIITDRLEKTVEEIITTLNPKQEEETIRYYLPILERYGIDTVNIDTFKKLSKTWKDINPSPEPLEIKSEDTFNEKMNKKLAVSKVVELLKKLHHIGYIHNDPHFENFMIGFNGEYRIIDFGQSKKIRGKFDTRNEFEELSESLEDLVIDGYTNLKYLR